MSGDNYDPSSYAQLPIGSRRERVSDTCPFNYFFAYLDPCKVNARSWHTNGRQLASLSPYLQLSTTLRSNMPTVTLPILHFNDVYRVATQKLAGVGTIDVTQFAAILDGLRSKWPQLPDGKRDGLVLFSGDLFAPSVESSVTRGSHMVSRRPVLVIFLVRMPTSICRQVPVLNYLAPDVSVTGEHRNRIDKPCINTFEGNHDFDFGIVSPHEFMLHSCVCLC